MTRSDEMFSTSMSSPSSLLSPRAKKRKAENDQTRPADPKAEAVLALIASEKAKITRTDAILFDKQMTKIQKVDKIERIQDQYLFLSRLERKMQLLLGVKPTEAPHDK